VSKPATAQPTFLSGVGHAFQAVGFVAKAPETWPLALFPAVLFALLSGSAATAGVVWLTPLVLSWLPGWDGTLGSVAEWTTRILMFLFSMVVGVWFALVLTPPLSGPALERLVQLQERELFVPERPTSSFLHELWVGAKAQALAVCFAVPLLLVLWLIQLFVPPAVIVTAPLSVLVTAMALAWNLFDYPLTLRGVAAGERLGFVKSHAIPLLGFALAFTALFSIPCFGVFMLPIGVVGATRLLYTLLEANPGELPQLERPRHRPNV
jgi:CysZ protein